MNSRSGSKNNSPQQSSPKSLNDDTISYILKQHMRNSKFPVNLNAIASVSKDFHRVVRNNSVLIKENRHMFGENFTKQFQMLLQPWLNSLNTNISVLPKMEFIMKLYVIIDIEYKVLGTQSKNENKATLIYPFKVVYKGKVTRISYGLNRSETKVITNEKDIVPFLVHSIFSHGIGFGEDDAIVTQYNIRFAHDVIDVIKNDEERVFGEEEWEDLIETVTKPIEIEQWQKNAFKQIYTDLKTRRQWKDTEDNVWFSDNFLNSLSEKNTTINTVVYYFSELYWKTMPNPQPKPDDDPKLYPPLLLGRRATTHSAR